MEKDAVANDLATLEEQLSTSKAQITSLSEILEKQKDKVVQDAVLQLLYAWCYCWAFDLFSYYAVALCSLITGYFHKARL